MEPIKASGLGYGMLLFPGNPQNSQVMPLERSVRGVDWKTKVGDFNYKPKTMDTHMPLPLQF